MKLPKRYLFSMGVLFLLSVLVSCNLPISDRTVNQNENLPGLTSVPALTIEPDSVSITPTLQPSRSLTICTSNEPASLFLYGDASTSTRSIHEALYDGPVDIFQYEYIPVLIESIPTTDEGSIFIEPIEVSPGELIVAADGLRKNLAEGVVYYPAGCASPECKVTFTGSDPVFIDQMVVRFQLRQGVYWSDGIALTVNDSIYSYEVARSLYPRVRAELLSSTQTYQALDDKTIEWRGIPGFRSTQAASFLFTPLPQHAWKELPTQDLLTSEISTRRPAGYGAYQIVEWLPGESLTLQPNPYYFRAEEGLPKFDTLVFRFVPDSNQALDMIIAGGCDILDENYQLDWYSAALEDLEVAGKIRRVVKEGVSWEQITFGLLPSTDGGTSAPSLLDQLKLRQAIGQCIDRQRIVDDLFDGHVAVLDSYVQPFHPYANLDLPQLLYDSQAASTSLQNSGWLDLDEDPSTPRISQGIQGVPEGTPLIFSYLVSDEDIRKQTAEIVRDSLSQCGVGLEIIILPQQALFAPGPEGPVFGRQFQMAQFSWSSSIVPACFLFLSSEIPGVYPGFPKGWGGANASGFANQQFDDLCLSAIMSLPGAPGVVENHRSAQTIIAEEIPVLPLYLHSQVLITRVDFCGLELDASVKNSLWNLERFDYGQNCNP